MKKQREKKQVPHNNEPSKAGNSLICWIVFSYSLQNNNTVMATWAELGYQFTQYKGSHCRYSNLGLYFEYS